MAEDRREDARERSPRERGLRFTDVRDQTGRLLFRISSAGILEIRKKGETVLINLWDYLGEVEG